MGEKERNKREEEKSQLAIKLTVSLTRLTKDKTQIVPFVGRVYHPGQI